MARRRGYTTQRKVAGGQYRRIRVPQPSVRPIHLLARKMILSERIAPDPWWFVTHRRGIRRPLVGEDPLEARAVSREVFNGTLPERIVYRYLTSVLRLIPGVDFDAQSSLAGGRLELGGIVADFIFPILRFVIQVQGPTHTTFIRERKDDEQRMILADLGYREVYALTDTLIYNESEFDEAMRRIFNIRPGHNMTSEGTPVVDVYGVFQRIEQMLRAI